MPNVKGKLAPHEKVPNDGGEPYNLLLTRGYKIMRNIELTNRKVLVDDVITDIGWTTRAEEDCKLFGLDIATEISATVVNEVDNKFSLSLEEKANLSILVLEQLK